MNAKAATMQPWKSMEIMLHDLHEVHQLKESKDSIQMRFSINLASICYILGTAVDFDSYILHRVKVLDSS